MSELKVRAIEPFTAEIVVPGDKSISHRAVMFGALSNGVCEISGFLPSEDCLSTVEAMRALGVGVEFLNDEKTKLRVHGTKGVFEAPDGPIDCGNSGTTMRLLSGILASQPFEVTLTGDASLSRRPMKRIATPLEKMGATITGNGEKLNPPLKVKGTDKIKSMHYESPVASAQVKSAVLLAGLKGSGVTSVNEPSISRDHTERLLDYLLVNVEREGTKVSVKGGQVLESRDMIVPGDISSAAFWVVAAAAFPESKLLVKNAGLNQTRVGVLNALIRMGAQIRERIDDSGCEPMGAIEVTGG
ncbi:MAG: 3-phosphoshikimate 1-carboxyvinyltransferase, partial [Verrucomicrobiota bacterium]